MKSHSVLTGVGAEGNSQTHSIDTAFALLGGGRLPALERRTLNLLPIGAVPILVFLKSSRINMHLFST